MGFYDFPHTRNYDTDLGYIIKRMQELDTKYGELELKYKEYTDEKVAESLTEFSNRLEATKKELNNIINTFKNETNIKLEAFSFKLDELEKDIQKALVSANAYTDNSIAQYDNYIKNYINSQLLDVKVLNYFTGVKVNIQEMFDYLATFHLTNAISYTQLANREITYLEFIDLDMNYTELALNGGSLIPQQI